MINIIVNIILMCMYIPMSFDNSCIWTGASVNHSKDGDSPLHIAAQLSNPELVKTLLDHGADHRAKNKAGSQPVDMAPPNSAVKLLRLTTHTDGI